MPVPPKVTKSCAKTLCTSSYLVDASACAETSGQPIAKVIQCIENDNHNQVPNPSQHCQSFVHALDVIKKTRDELDLAIQRLTEEHELQGDYWEEGEGDEGEVLLANPRGSGSESMNSSNSQDKDVRQAIVKRESSKAFPAPAIREVWIKLRGNASRKLKKGATSRSSTIYSQDNDDVAQFSMRDIVQNETDNRLEEIMARFIIPPSKTVRVIWDFFGAFLVACDMITIPLQVFDLPRNPVTTVLGWVTLLFWTIDMFFTFFVGYPYKGKIIMSARSIALHYLCTWFVLDVVLVIGDWVTTASTINSTDDDSEAADTAGFSKMLRVMRGLRVLRLLRLLKMKRLLEELEEMLDSEYIQLMFSLIKLVLAVLFLNHMIACMWFWVGTGNGDKHWVNALGYDDQDHGYQYVTSLHWALTQFTPATQNIHPYNYPERLYATLIVILALITFSTFLSTLTATMTQLRRVAADETKQFLTLRRYLHQQKAKTELRRRIVKYLEYAYRSRKHNIRESSVTLFDLLSDPLRDELAHSRSTPNLSVHPFLSAVNTNWTQLMQRLSRFAFGQVFFAADDAIFSCGDSASRMFFLVVGDVDYNRMGKQSQSSALYIHDWAAEVALWGIWHYVGDLVSRNECELMYIEATKFGQAMSMNLDVLQVASEYAAAFMNALGDVDPEDYSDILEKHFMEKTFSVEESIASRSWKSGAAFTPKRQ